MVSVVRDQRLLDCLDDLEPLELGMTQIQWLIAAGAAMGLAERL